MDPLSETVAGSSRYPNVGASTHVRKLFSFRAGSDVTCLICSVLAEPMNAFRFRGSVSGRCPSAALPFVLCFQFALSCVHGSSCHK